MIEVKVSPEELLTKQMFEVLHANKVLLDAIDKVCAGIVSLDQLKAWRRNGANPSLILDDTPEK